MRAFVNERSHERFWIRYVAGVSIWLEETPNIWRRADDGHAHCETESGNADNDAHDTGRNVMTNHCRMSNFTPCINKGLSMYFCATHLLLEMVVKSAPTACLIKFRFAYTEMPRPRLIAPC